MNLIKFSVNRRVTITMMVLIIVLLGFISLSKLGLDLLPDIEYPVVSVMTTYPGVASQEIEEQVTRPVEESVSMISGVKSVNSSSEEGVSVVIVEFEWGTNLDFAAQDIRDRIGLIKEWLPEDVSTPLVLKFDLSMMPVVFYGATGECGIRELRKVLEDRVKDRIERIDGVASCMLMGGQKREINISIDKVKLVSYNIGLSQVVSALRAANLNFSAGHIVKGYKEYSIRIVGEYENIDEIGNTIISSKDGVPIRLKDIAELKDTHKEIRSYGRTQGKESIIVFITKQAGANTVIISNKINKELQKIKAILPHNIQLHLFFDQGDMIKKISKRTGETALWGGILAILFIFFFLRNWRPTLTIALAIPFSIITTFIAIYFAGYTLNMMTLAGIALGVGMLVDNSIVVIENIYRKMEEGSKRKDAAIQGTTEVGMAITASTLTTVSVFIPLIFSAGIAGRLSRSLALTISFALFASLFIAFTLVPMLASTLFKKRGETSQQGKFDIFFNSFREKYGRFLQYALTHRRKTLLITVMIFIITLCLIPLVGTEFMPKMDIPFLSITVTMPVGTSLEETNRVASQFEDILNDIPEVEITSTWIGLSEATQYDVAYGSVSPGVNQAQVMGKLVERNARKRSVQKIVEEIRKKIPHIEGATIEFVDASGQMFGGKGGPPINVKIFGKDLSILKRISEQIASRIKDVKGIKDIDTSLRHGKPELQIRIDKEKAALFGLTVHQIGQEVRTAIQGMAASKFREKGEEVNILVEFRNEDVKDIKSLENIPIMTPSFLPRSDKRSGTETARQVGTSILLKQVAEIVLTEGPVRIEREEQNRKVSVTANIERRDLGSVVKDIAKKIESIKKTLPSGYSIEFGGEYKEMKETFITLGIAFILALILVYMVMAAQFESFVHPFAIMFT
ncbi:efflux RND transporter permease subunit, partial [candidate division WOR-3 bacterium]|nr:efflux RND transporter permease subunit [candidate division WOR-3 bacterium]